MKLHVLNRKVHYWGSLLVAIPVLIIIVSGLFLQVKKEFAWIQPAENRGVARVPSLTLDAILETCRAIPEAEIEYWADIHRLDIRPSKGMLKVVARNNWEVQIDSQTGEVLQVAFRRSDIIEAIHDGSWFHDLARLWVFLPSALGLTLLWLTGMYLIALPYSVRWGRARKKSRAMAVFEMAGPSATGSRNSGQTA